MTDADIARTGCICCWLDGHEYEEYCIGAENYDRLVDALREFEAGKGE